MLDKNLKMTIKQKWNSDFGGQIVLLETKDSKISKLAFCRGQIMLNLKEEYTVEELNKKLQQFSVYKINDFLGWDSIPNDCSVIF